MHNLRHAQQQCPELLQRHQEHQSVYFTQADITDVGNFSPFTHIYMFDIGFPPAALMRVANSFNVSKTVKALVSFQRPRHIIQTYGFQVVFEAKIQTRMCGSSEGHTAYIYRSIHNPKANSLTKTAPVDLQRTLKGEEEGDEGEQKEQVRRRSPRSPTKQKRKQQAFVKDYFATSKSRPSSSKRLKTVQHSKTTVQPNVLFPGSSTTKSGCCELFQDGFDILSSSSPTSSTASYSTWLDEAGQIGGECEGRPRRTAARHVAYCA